MKLETIERMLKNKDWHIRVAAVNVCQGRTDIPLEWIERRLKDEDYDVRAAAFNTCQGRTDIPLEWIERRLKDEDYDVRKIASNIYQTRLHTSTRSFEPPEKVYKKCLGDVIVVANIPSDAHVRGSINAKCRASKAVITDIIGDLYGEKVGISMHNLKTQYHVGDRIEVEDFDLSDSECSTGFHFFCTLEEAKGYDA